MPRISIDKIFLEFEGMRQAGDIFLNGKQIGLYENGVTAYGLDISGAVHFGNEENVLAVKLDNRTDYAERSTGTTFQWNANDFNPDHGGINRHLWLHVTGKIYQTLPLYYGLETTGVYVHAANFNIAGKSADVTVESEVRNASGDRATVELSAVIVDSGGQVRAKFDGNSVDMVDGEKSILTATGALKGARFWSPEDPYFYDVYTILTVDGKTVDVNKLVTGFRKTEFKGGAGTGGVFGVNAQPANGYVFAFPDVEFAPGSLKAVGRNDGKSVAQEELATAGADQAHSHGGPAGLRSRRAGRGAH
jgi:beta-galactosidase